MNIWTLSKYTLVCMEQLVMTAEPAEWFKYIETTSLETGLS